MSTSPAAQLARLKISYGLRWHISASVPGTGPRTITAIETATGRRLQARNESEMETKLMHAGRRHQPNPGTEPHLPRWRPGLGR